MNNYKLEIENRKILYYKKYHYRAKFNLPGVHHVGIARNSRELEKIIANHLKWSEYKLPDNRLALENLLDWKIKNQDNISIRTEYRMCSIFSNDLTLLQTLSDVVDDVSYTKAELYGDPGIIELLKPKHNYRVYFKSKRIQGTKFVSELNEFLELHKNSVFPCRALNTWVKDSNQPAWRYNWLSDSHYIEYDDESTKILLNLFLDGYLAKTYKVKMRDY